MFEEIVFLIVGAIVGLLVSLITSVFNYRLNRKQWMEIEHWESQKRQREELAGTWQELSSLLADDVQRKIVENLRGNDEVVEKDGLLPREISSLEIRTEDLIETLGKSDENLEIGQLLEISLNTLKADTN